MTRTRLQLCDERDASLSRHDDIIDVGKTGGSDGGGTMDNLEKRVTNLENDVKVIRNDVTTLLVRSENVGTKVDISDIRIEIANLNGGFRTEITDKCGSLRNEMIGLRGELATEKAELQSAFKTAITDSQTVILKELDTRFQRIEDKSRWKWGSIVVPLVAALIGGALSALVTILTATHPPA